MSLIRILILSWAAVVTTLFISWVFRLLRDRKFRRKAQRILAQEEALGQISSLLDRRETGKD